MRGLFIGCIPPVSRKVLRNAGSPPSPGPEDACSITGHGERRTILGKLFTRLAKPQAGEGRFAVIREYGRLVNVLRGCIHARPEACYRRVTAYARAKQLVNFFAHPWGREGVENSGMAAFNPSDFMGGGPIQYAKELDAAYSANEARPPPGGSRKFPLGIAIFRRIYFSPDPDIHERWERAGVHFYGEKF
jgi:hypothetical protein